MLDLLYAKGTTSDADVAPATIRRKARCPSTRHPLEYSIQHGLGKGDVAKRVSGQHDAIFVLRGKTLVSRGGSSRLPCRKDGCAA